MLHRLVHGQPVPAQRFEPGTQPHVAQRAVERARYPAVGERLLEFVGTLDR